MELTTKINFEQKFNSMYMLDTLLIVKLIEQYKGQPLANGITYFQNIRSEYIAYDVVWWLLDIFLYHTEIGELDYEGEQYKLTLYSLSEAHHIKSSTQSEDAQIDLDNFTENLVERINNANPTMTMALYSHFCEDEHIIRGCFEFGDISWHAICEILLDAHKACELYLKGEKI